MSIATDSVLRKERKNEMEYLYEKFFNMRKKDNDFSNVYYNMQIVKNDKLIEIKLFGRWTSKDDLVQYLPKEMEFVLCECENGKIKIEFKYNGKPIEVVYPLTNRKEQVK